MKQLNKLIDILTKLSELTGKHAESLGHSPKNKYGTYDIDLDQPWFNTSIIINNDR